MKRFRMIAILLSLVMSVVAAPALAQEWTGNVNVLLGVKNMDKDDWRPVEEHGELGLTFDVRQESWPASLALGCYVSGAQENAPRMFSDRIVSMKYESATVEFHVGARKILDTMEVIRPYVGAGITAISAATKMTAVGLSMDDSDGGMGFYTEGGFYVTLAESINLGLDVKYSRAQVTLFDQDIEAGGGHVALFAGYHW